MTQSTSVVGCGYGNIDRPAGSTLWVACHQNKRLIEPELEEHRTPPVPPTSKLQRRPLAMEDKVQGLFVGLWAPTLLGGVNYFKVVRTAKNRERPCVQIPKYQCRFSFGSEYLSGAAELVMQLVQ